MLTIQAFFKSKHVSAYLCHPYCEVDKCNKCYIIRYRNLVYKKEFCILFLIPRAPVLYRQTRNLFRRTKPLRMLRSMKVNNTERDALIDTLQTQLLTGAHLQKSYANQISDNAQARLHYADKYRATCPSQAFIRNF